MSELKKKERAAIALIEAAARLGEVCPTNGKLALALDVSISRASTMLQELEQRGFLIVLRFTNARQITVVDSGLTTARPATRVSMWEDRDTRPKRQGDDVPVSSVARGVPCGCCGCRSDACQCGSGFRATKLPSTAASSIVSPSASHNGSRHAMGTHG